MKKAILFLAFIGAVSFSCSDDDDQVNTEPCTTIVVNGLEVTVKDGAAILTSGITVTATDGDYIEQLTPSDVSGAYKGADERAGDYIITVTGDGYQPYTSETITVEADECHVITEELTVNLSPM
ncbi:carboxypeptidase-like regulatory domain-containing protein [Flavobacterium sp. RHBU_24]|uniref:carboxypeptidase-like regulatory domain-containing protein n=1 Tax=Flavobacterium sp. RHBU_24 TaxID=3391185 RepID=UPI00398555CE